MSSTKPNTILDRCFNFISMAYGLSAMTFPYSQNEADPYAKIFSNTAVKKKINFSAINKSEADLYSEGVKTAIEYSTLIEKINPMKSVQTLAKSNLCIATNF